MVADPGYDPGRSSPSSQSPEFISLRRTPVLSAITGTLPLIRTGKTFPFERDDFTNLSSRVYGATGRNRTGTPVQREILSLLCLPISPQSHIILVPGVRLELTRLTTLASKTSMATITSPGQIIWRKRWDSNPRTISSHLFSRQAPSAELSHSSIIWRPARESNPDLQFWRLM